jgi:hypothetical protein
MDTCIAVGKPYETPPKGQPVKQNVGCLHLFTLPVYVHDCIANSRDVTCSHTLVHSIHIEVES